jgi:hypothetical protein
MEHALPQRPGLAWQVPRYAAPLAGSLIVLTWVVVTTAIHPAQFSDSIEQYNWAHSLEWGYWKHPPLSTWIMRGAIALLGVSHWTAPVLAAACLVASIWFVWALARRILPARAADLAVVLWPLHEALSARADVYNHNTALVLLCAATAWASARAARHGRTRDWVLAGGLAGLALLAKYQALVTIAGVLFALWDSGALRSPRTRRQLACAAAVASALFLPHVLWLFAHGWPTLAYVERSARHLEPLERAPMLAGFLLTELSMVAAMLLAAAYAGFGPRAAPATDGAADRVARAWLRGLVAVPLVAIALTVLGAGLMPQKMWGIHTALFLPLWLAWRVDRARPDGPVLMRAVTAAAAITVSTIAYSAVEMTVPGMRVRIHSTDRLVPATELAHAVLADWHRLTACPLRLVSGTGFAAGLVSVYSGAYPVVLEDGDFAKSPWVDPRQLAESGHAQVYGPVPVSQVPRDAARLPVPAPAKMHGEGAAIWWRIEPPGVECPH